MIKNKKNRFFDITVSDWISASCYNLHQDAISFSNIVEVGRYDFNLIDLELDEFVSRSLDVLLEHGAFPALIQTGEWTRSFAFGDSKEDAFQSIMNAWRRQGRQDPDIDFLWLALFKN